VDLPERLMMMVSSASVFVNRFPPQCSLTPQGREKLRARLGVKRRVNIELQAAIVAWPRYPDVTRSCLLPRLALPESLVLP
jgi:hypothetical protein